MYLGIDIGGTKTLLAVFDDQGTVQEETKFPTPGEYPQFLENLKAAVAGLKIQDFKAAGIGIPGRLDRTQGRVIRLGNLAWEDQPIRDDCREILGCPIAIENDANMAALSEAAEHADYGKVLYFTISTGIGTGVTYKQRLVPSLLDSEGGHIRLHHDGQLEVWEKFASGKFIYEHFGKKASDITDEETWKIIVNNLSLGIYDLVAVIQPDVVIIGGSIGTYFDRYGKLLNDELQTFKSPVVAVPPVIQAKRPEEAVIYGCYELAKQE